MLEMLFSNATAVIARALVLKKPVRFVCVAVSLIVGVVSGYGLVILAMTDADVFNSEKVIIDTVD